MSSLPLHSTKNDLSVDVRTRVIELLNARLADAVDLMLQAKQAHWNVRGPSFAALHALFDETAKQVAEFADALAERAVQLGGTAAGTARLAAEYSTLEEYPLGIARGADHLAALSSAVARFGKLARLGIDQATRIADADTADLFTEVSRSTDKLLWMLEVQLT